MTNTQTMREGLLQMVEAFNGGRIEHALFTTFNFDPNFFEKNILPLLGGFTLDDVQSMSTEALAREMYHPLKNLQVVVAYDQAVLQGFQGCFRYSLLPKHQRGGFFHAKIIVLTGVNAQQAPMATVMVSSGNMTFSGWGNNIEVAAWTLINRANAKELLGFYTYLDDPELETGAKILREIQSEEASPTLFLHYPSTSNTLFDRLFKPNLKGNVHIFSPYWGEDAIQSFKSSKTSVYCYPAKEQHGHQFPLSPERAKQLAFTVQAIKGEESFRHAKAYYWDGYMAIGSANCTSQALHSQNNVEAMLLFSGQLKPDILNCSEILEEWLLGPSAEEGPEPIPMDVLVIADYAKRCYQVSINVTDPGRCEKWQLMIDDKQLRASADLEEEIPFGDAKTIARVYRIEWQVNADSNSLMGMIIPKHGSDVELGYRPKRNMAQILLDMLRHKASEGGGGKGSSPPNTGNDLDGDESEFIPEADDYDFDMYGMYQSFYHLRKDLGNAKDSVNLSWMYNEISDTLQEIILAIQNGEVQHPVQQWLILQEAVDIAKQLPENISRKFSLYDDLQIELNQQVLNTLEDGSMMNYRIEPEALLDWTRKELGYER
jgi:hypothetical protein